MSAEKPEVGDIGEDIEGRKLLVNAALICYLSVKNE